MAVIVSPGVHTTEKDFSLYAPALATSIFGVVGTASKGPTDTVTLISDEATLVNIFGNPTVDNSPHYGLHAALRYLRRGRQCKYVRVATYDATASGSITKGGGGSVAVAAVSSGSWGNGIQVVVTSGHRAGTWKLTVQYNGSPVEVYDNLLVGTGNAADSNYWITRINPVSEYITIGTDESSTTLTTGTYTLAGGLDGAPANTGDVIGVIVGAVSTGLQLFRNPESIDVNLIAAPGRSETSVISEILDICSSRGDCFALLDPPLGLSVDSIVDWHNGLGGGPSDPAAALNSSYGALYWPWLEVYDGFGDQNVWVPPSGHVAGVMAFTDFVADPWWAPAGLNRAHLVDVLNVEHSATQGERDYMYGNTNAVNPIINYTSQGITIWGQKTLNRATSALNRINVRRMLLYLRKVVATSVVYLDFEPNDSDTWDRFTALVTPVCDAIKARRGIYDYRVICDETTNTAEVIDRNEMRAKILIKPTKTAEIISIEFTLLATGARFEEF